MASSAGLECGPLFSGPVPIDKRAVIILRLEHSMGAKKLDPVVGREPRGE